MWQCVRSDDPFFEPAIIIQLCGSPQLYRVLMSFSLSLCMATYHQECVIDNTLHSSDISTSRGRAGEPPSVRWQGRSWRPSYSAWSIWCHWTSRVTLCWTTAQFHTLKRLWVGQGGYPTGYTIMSDSEFWGISFTFSFEPMNKLSLFQHWAVQEQHLSFPRAEEAPAVSGLIWHHPL